MVLREYIHTLLTTNVLVQGCDRKASLRYGRLQLVEPAAHGPPVSPFAACRAPEGTLQASPRSHHKGHDLHAIAHRALQVQSHCKVSFSFLIFAASTTSWDIDNSY